MSFHRIKKHNMLGPILPGWYVGPNVDYTDSTNIKKRRQQTVGMGCTNWDTGLTSGGISMSPFHYDVPRRHLLPAPQDNPTVNHDSFKR